VVDQRANVPGCARRGCIQVAGLHFLKDCQGAAQGSIQFGHVLAPDSLACKGRQSGRPGRPAKGIGTVRSGLGDDLDGLARDGDHPAVPAPRPPGHRRCRRSAERLPECRMREAVVPKWSQGCSKIRRDGGI